MRTIDYLKGLITNRKNYLITIFVFYVFGYFIYTITGAYYFSYLPLKDFRLLNYLAASIWWILTLYVFYTLFHYLEEKLKLKYSWFKYFIIAIAILLPFLSYLAFFIIYSNQVSNGIINFIIIPVRMFFSFHYFEWYTSKILKIIFNSYFLIFYFSSLFISYILSLDYLKIKKAFFIITIFINLISFSQSIYSHIPKSIGGGQLNSVSICFKKGYIPHDLKWIIKDCYYVAYLVEEDVDNYFITFAPVELNKDRNHGYFPEIYYMRRFAHIIPKKNIIYLKFH